MTSEPILVPFAFVPGVNRAVRRYPLLLRGFLQAGIPTTVVPTPNAIAASSPATVLYRCSWLGP